MVVLLCMALQLVRIKVNLAQVAADISLHLIIEMPRIRMTAFATGRHRSSTHSIAKLHHCNKAVAAGSVPLLCPWVGLGPKRSQGTPGGVREPHWRAWHGIVEGLHNISGQALIAVDVSPGSPPGAEVRGELIGDRGQRFQSHVVR